MIRQRGVLQRAGNVGECQFVEKPPAHINTECPVCHYLLREPVQITCCGNMLCSACFSQLSKARQACPLCRKTELKGFPDSNHKRIMEGFRVYCCYRGEGGAGCQWVGKLGDHSNHLNATPSDNTRRLQGCEYVPLDCSFCRTKVLRWRLNHHETAVCPQRRMKCEHCDYVSTYVDVTGKHKENCRHIPIPCKKCKNEVKKSEMDTHLAINCPEVFLNCEFSGAGCNEQVLRKNMADHMQRMQVYHLSLLNKKLTQLLQAVYVIAVFVLVILFFMWIM